MLREYAVGPWVSEDVLQKDENEALIILRNTSFEELRAKSEEAKNEEDKKKP